MQYEGKGDPSFYSYMPVAKSIDKNYIDSIVKKYNIRLVDPDAFIEDGYEIVAEELTDKVNAEFIEKHPSKKYTKVSQEPGKYEPVEMPTIKRIWPKL